MQNFAFHVTCVLEAIGLGKCTNTVLSLWSLETFLIRYQIVALESAPQSFFLVQQVHSVQQPCELQDWLFPFLQLRKFICNNFCVIIPLTNSRYSVSVCLSVSQMYMLLVIASIDSENVSWKVYRAYLVYFVERSKWRLPS